MTMRTTLNLDEQLIRELMDVTAATTKTDAIHQAAAELIRKKKLERLKSLSGTLHLDLDWNKLEQAEIRRQASTPTSKKSPGFTSTLLRPEVFTAHFVECVAPLPQRPPADDPASPREPRCRS
jgi:hypothetical protein